MKRTEYEKNMITTISIRVGTKDELEKLGTFRENWDELLLRLIKEVKGGK